MADLNLYLPKVLKLEAGYQAFPNDTANYDSQNRLIGTNHGIGARTLETYFYRTKRVDLSKWTQENFIDTMKSLSEDTAKKICKVLFWDIANADLIKNQSVAEFIVDWFWGSGNYGLQWEQGCLRTLDLDITPDNKITPEEVETINNYIKQEELFNFLKSERIKFIEKLVKDKPEKYKMFHKGWLSRINSFHFAE